MREELVTVCVGARVVHFKFSSWPGTRNTRIPTPLGIVCPAMARISKCSRHGTHCHLIVAPSLLTVHESGTTISSWP